MQKWLVIPYALLQLSHVPDFQGCVLVLKNHTPAVSPSFCIAVLTRLQIPSQGSILQWEKTETEQVSYSVRSPEEPVRAPSCPISPGQQTIQTRVTLLLSSHWILNRQPKSLVPLTLDRLSALHHISVLISILYFIQMQ